MSVSLFVQSAAESSDQNSGGSFLFTLVFMGLIGAAMYFLMIRPQRRRMKETVALQQSIGVGDEVVTNAGIYGFVDAMDGDIVWLSIDDDTTIRIARSALSRKINPAQESAGGPESSSGE